MKNIFSNLQGLFDLLCSVIHKYTKTSWSTKSFCQFLLYSSSLVRIQNILTPLVLFLEFEQPHFEQFDPDIFETKSSRFKFFLIKWFVYILFSLERNRFYYYTVLNISKKIAGVYRSFQTILFFWLWFERMYVMSSAAQLHPNCVTTTSRHGQRFWRNPSTWQQPLQFTKFIIIKSSSNFVKGGSPNKPVTSKKYLPLKTRD